MHADLLPWERAAGADHGMGMKLKPTNPGGDLVEIGPSSDFADAPADHEAWGCRAGCKLWETLQLCRARAEHLGADLHSGAFLASQPRAIAHPCLTCLPPSASDA